jgi:hypothetical protein
MVGKEATPMRPAFRAAVGPAAVVLLALGPPPARQTPTPREFLDSDSRPFVPEAPSEHHEFTFARAAYNGSGWGWGSWSTDYPKADRQFLIGVQRLTRIDAYGGEPPVRLEDSELRRYPFLYAIELELRPRRRLGVGGEPLLPPRPVHLRLRLGINAMVFAMTH